MAEDSGLSPGQPPSTLRKSLRISLRKSTPTTSDDTPKRRRKTAAEVSRDDRERMKQNPEKYKLHREYETNRVKLLMARLGEEDRKNYQKVTNDRVRRWREKQKMLGKNVSTYIAPKTRKKKEEKRAAWKKQKVLDRANMSEEAKKLQNERRRRKYQEKKAAMLDCDRRSAPSSNFNQPPVPLTPASSQETSPAPASTQETSPAPASTQEMAAERVSLYRSRNSTNKASWRARKAMPSVKEKFVEVFNSILKKSTPNTEKIHSSEHSLGPSIQKKT